MLRFVVSWPLDVKSNERGPLTPSIGETIMSRSHSLAGDGDCLTRIGSGKMYKAAELREFKQRLLHLRARVRGDVAQLTDEALERGEGNGDSKSPTHIAELGTQNYEQDFALRVVENDQEVLDEIKAALKRIDDGSFGACESCRTDGRSPSRSVIPKTRLRAIPYTRNCVSCERKREELSL